MGGQAQPLPKFADQLNQAIAEADGGNQLTNAKLHELVGGRWTVPYLRMLRSGLRDNPTISILVGLGDALKVHPAYFVGGRRDLLSGECPAYRDGALQVLFETIYPDGRGPYSPEEVAKEIQRDYEDSSISKNTIRNMLSGESPDPQLKQVLALSWFFTVNPAYFLDDVYAGIVDQQTAEYNHIRHLKVESLVARMSGAEGRSRLGDHRTILRAVTKALANESSGQRFTFKPSSRGADTRDDGTQ